MVCLSAKARISALITWRVFQAAMPQLHATSTAKSVSGAMTTPVVHLPLLPACQRRRPVSTDFAGFSARISLLSSGILLNPALPGVTRLNHFGARFGAHPQISQNRLAGVAGMLSSVIGQLRNFAMSALASARDAAWRSRAGLSAGS